MKINTAVLFLSGLLLCSCRSMPLTYPSANAPQLPTPSQYRWHQQELQVFADFGLNTPSGNEWGAGTDSPDLFNPTPPNC